MLRLLRRVLVLSPAHVWVISSSSSRTIIARPCGHSRWLLAARLEVCVLGGSSPSLRVLESGATSPLCCCSKVMYAGCTRRARGCPARASLAPVISPLECAGGGGRGHLGVYHVHAKGI
ncbi:hypothetical protein B0H13DRAFT_2101794 [Mycena leptocephala]|nr:hypothetical protein B0H13DRAFT_2101794 [Mycena leptocephala]